MTNRERFHSLMNFEPVDRLTVTELAPYWQLTLDRWHTEGLPEDCTEWPDITSYFGLDAHVWCHAYSLGPETPDPPRKGLPRVNNAKEYHEIMPTLYSDPPSFLLLPAEPLDQIAERQQSGEAWVRLIFDGYFWHPRELLGIEQHFYAFGDQPDVIHEMNQNVLAFQLQALDTLCEYCVPDLVMFSEDMSYNRGPMISKALFDGFVAPYYRQIMPHLQKHGILVILDTDGDVAELLPWFLELGVHGVTPLERQAGVDVNRLRCEYPDLRMIGAFDKMVMPKGEAAMREEFERLLPVMRSGGYIPTVDHQTPPGVSIDNYRLYLDLLREYAGKAAQ